MASSVVPAVRTYSWSGRRSGGAMLGVLPDITRVATPVDGEYGLKPTEHLVYRDLLM